MGEVCERVSYRATKHLVEGMMRDGQLVQLDCGYCYLPLSRVLDGKATCSNLDCEALVTRTNSVAETKP